MSQQNAQDLVQAAQQAFMAIDAQYQQADINEKVALSEERNKAFNGWLKLRDDAALAGQTIDPADIAEMKKLKSDVDQAAQLQQVLAIFLSIVSKYVTI